MDETIVDTNNLSLMDDIPQEVEDFQIDEYDLTSAPNDFNILTISSFISSGAVKIPGFQRHFVWDIKRASKLIDSIIIGIPVPQIFLYEDGRNSFLVIDGQQRLMSIYYFVKKRFPRRDKRVEIRRIFAEKGDIPEDIMSDDSLFENFNLRFDERSDGSKNKFAGLNYDTLGEYRTQFDLRTIRNIIVKQNSPKGDQSSMFEMFNRLNTGGMNLYPQEIRASMYNSLFYQMLYRINLNENWRRLIGDAQPDIRMRDIEILLRCFAMLIEGGGYNSSMAKFLNSFSYNAKKYNLDVVDTLEKLLIDFLDRTSRMDVNVFWGISGRFSVSVFEAVLYGTVEYSQITNTYSIRNFDSEMVVALKTDPKFIEYSTARSTNKNNITPRLEMAKNAFLA